jgi:hypothetical protein
MLLRETIILAKKQMSPSSTKKAEDIEDCNIGNEGDEQIVKEDIVQFIEDIIMEGISFKPQNTQKGLQRMMSSFKNSRSIRGAGSKS